MLRRWLVRHMLHSTRYLYFSPFFLFLFYICLTTYNRTAKTDHHGLSARGLPHERVVMQNPHEHAMERKASPSLISPSKTQNNSLHEHSRLKEILIRSKGKIDNEVNDNNQNQQEEEDTDFIEFDPSMMFVQNPLDLKKRPTYLEEYRNPCWMEEEGRMRCLPYFLLIGMMRCGTTDLYQRLLIHPFIVSPDNQRRNLNDLKNRFNLKAVEHAKKGLKMKEPHFWAHHWNTGTYLASYVNHFDGAAAHIRDVERMDHRKQQTLHPVVTLDASTTTFWDNTAWRLSPDNHYLSEPKYLNPHYVHHVLPDAKILLILRDPTERIYSEYHNFGLSMDKSPEKFDTFIKESIQAWNECLKSSSFINCLYFEKSRQLAVQKGLYAPILKDWMKVYPKNQIGIILFEEYVDDPLKVLKRVFQFLGVGDLPSALEQAVDDYNAEHERMEPSPMLIETRTQLNEFYAPYNTQLAELLGDDRFLWDGKTDAWSNEG